MAAIRKKATGRKTVKHKATKVVARKTARKSEAKKTSKTVSRRKGSPRTKPESAFHKMLTAEGWRRLMTGAKK